MANEGVLRGLSLAMTIQNATGFSSHGGNEEISSPMIIYSDKYLPMQKEATSRSDYLTPDFSGNYEICVTAICFSLLSYTQRLFGRMTNTGAGPFIDISASWYEYSCYFAANSAFFGPPRSQYPPVLNQWMVYDLVFQNGTVTASIRYRDTGEIYWTESRQTTGSGPTNIVYVFGGAGSSTTDFIARDCILDFSNTYIKTGNEIVWGRKAGS